MAAEAAPAALVVATRAAVGGCGPGHVLAPQRTALEDGQGQGGRELKYTAALRTKPLPPPRRLVPSTLRSTPGRTRARHQPPGGQPRSLGCCRRRGWGGTWGSAASWCSTPCCRHWGREEVPEVRAAAHIRAVDGDDEDMRQLAEASRTSRARRKRKRRKKKVPKSSSSTLLPRGRAGDQGIMHEYADGETEEVIE